MTKERAKELSDLLKAYSEGKTIELRVVSNSPGCYQWEEFSLDTSPLFSDPGLYQYRVKPEPVLVPFTFEDKDLFKDKTTYRHYPWFRTVGSPSAFGFHGTNCDLSSASAGTGSRLCLKNEKLAKYLGTQFKDEYQKMLAL